MNNIELEKQAQIGRQAMNIQKLELVFPLADSDGKPIEGTERQLCVLYNLENTSVKEVEEIINSGMFGVSDRILVARPEQVAHIFPHAGESKNTKDHAYWRSLAYKNDHIHCECSCCGWVTENITAVKIGSTSDDYVGIVYRFCPKCGSMMNYKPNDEES